MQDMGQLRRSGEQETKTVRRAYRTCDPEKRAVIKPSDKLAQPSRRWMMPFS